MILISLNFSNYILKCYILQLHLQNYNGITITRSEFLMNSLEEIQKLANECYGCKNKPCTKGCPLGNSIPEFIEAVKKRKFRKCI